MGRRKTPPVVKEEKEEVTMPENPQNQGQQDQKENKDNPNQTRAMSHQDQSNLMKQVRQVETERMLSPERKMIPHLKAKNSEYLINISHTTQSIPDAGGTYRSVPPNGIIHKDLVQPGVANKAPWLAAFEGDSNKMSKVGEDAMPYATSGTAKDPTEFGVPWKSADQNQK